MLTWIWKAAKRQPFLCSRVMGFLGLVSTCGCLWAQNEPVAGYVVNLMSTLSPVALEGRLAPERFAPHDLYLTTIEINGRTWYRVRLGVFDQASQAEQALNQWHREFMDAWVDGLTRAELVTENAGAHLDTQMPQPVSDRQKVAPDRGRYVVVLQSSREYPSRAELARFRELAQQEVFISEYRNGDGSWYRVSTAGYRDKATANLQLEQLRSSFPSAWLRRLHQVPVDEKKVTVFSAPETQAAVTDGELSESLEDIEPVPAVPTTSPTTTRARSGLFAINLRSAPHRFSAEHMDEIRPNDGERVYVIQFTNNASQWYRLRLGPYATESLARERLVEVRRILPDAWIDATGKADTEALGGLPVESVSEVRFDETIDPAPEITTRDAAPIAPSVEIDQPFLYAVIVNSQSFGVTTVLKTADGRLLVRGSDLDAWGLQRPPQALLEHQGQTYYDPSDLPGSEVEVDNTRLVLSLNFAPGAFYPTRVGGRALSPEPTPSSLGGFANYDLFATHTNQGVDDVTRVQGIFELGGFGPWGSLTTDLVAQDLIASGGAPEDREFIRLESRYRRDWPSDALTLTLGDSISRGGIWGRSVRFGGGQFGRNYSVQPNFVTFPLPGVRGEAVLPSTAELYINESLRQTQSLTPGAFEVIDVPVITGGGEAKLVVTDLLGRQQVITVPFYTSNELLREGLSDYGMEVGFVRERFAIKSNDYGRALAVGTARYGFTDRFTGEGRVEVLDNQRTAGLGGNYVLPFGALMTAAIATSHDDDGFGQLGTFGLERRNTRGFTFRTFAQYATRDFTQLGQGETALPARLRLTASIGTPPIGPGSPSFTYVLDDNWNGLRRELVAGFYSFPLFKYGAVSLFATKSLDEPRTLTYGLSVVHRFGERDTAVVSYNASDGNDEGSLEVQRSLPLGEGTGYRLQVDAFGDTTRQEAEVFQRTAIGTYGAGVSHSPGSASYRLSADGGIAVLGGDAKLMRPIEDSFAKVKVDDYADVGVFLNNQEVSRTDENGTAWLPDLLDYQENVIAIEVLDLPLDAEVKSDKITLVPYFRSGLSAEFPVQPLGGALLSIVFEDGEPAPAGAKVYLLDEIETVFPVAFRGEVFVTGLSDKATLELRWRNQACRFDVEVPVDAGPIPRIGPITCAGLTR